MDTILSRVSMYEIRLLNIRGPQDISEIETNTRDTSSEHLIDILTGINCRLILQAETVTLKVWWIPFPYIRYLTTNLFVRYNELIKTSIACIGIFNLSHRPLKRLNILSAPLIPSKYVTYCHMPHSPLWNVKSRRQNNLSSTMIARFQYTLERKSILLAN